MNLYEYIYMWYILKNESYFGKFYEYAFKKFKQNSKEKDY